MLTLLQDNIRFCIISTRMEDALAVSPIIPEAELAALDNSFVDWYKSSSVHPNTPRSYVVELPGIAVTKAVMRWRYLLSRIILHRPVLLWYAMRRMQFSALSPEKKASIELCRDVAYKLINDIASTWRGQKACQMSGWNATWLLYQTVMVPLLSLFSDPHDPAVVERSRYQVELTLIALTEMRGWSITCHRSFEVVSRIYEASKRLNSNQDGAQGNQIADAVEPAGLSLQNLGPRPNFVDTNLCNAGGNQELFMNHMFDSLNWSPGWDDNDYPFETPSTGWDYHALNGWGLPQGYDSYFDAGLFTALPLPQSFQEIDGNNEIGISHSPGP